MTKDLGRAVKGSELSHVDLPALIFARYEVCKSDRHLSHHPICSHSSATPFPLQFHSATSLNTNSTLRCHNLKSTFHVDDQTHACMSIDDGKIFKSARPSIGRAYLLLGGFLSTRQAHEMRSISCSCMSCASVTGLKRSSKID